MFLLCLHSVIPGYISKEIQLSMRLGEVATHELKLSNPSTREIEYWIRSEEDPDFVFTCPGEVKLAPSSMTPVAVQLRASFFKSFRAKLFIIMKRSSLTKATPIVYEFVVEVVGRNPLKSISVSASLYQPESIMLKIENPLESRDTLDLVVSLEFPEDCSVFISTSDKLKCKTTRPASLEIKFFPLVMQQERCEIIFTDRDACEFVYELRVDVCPPAFTHEYQLGDLFLHYDNEIELTFTNRNAELQAMRKLLEDFTKGKRKMGRAFEMGEVFTPSA